MKHVLKKIIRGCVWGLLAIGCAALGEELTGEWQGRVFFHRIVAQLEQKDTNVWGIVSVHSFFGGVDTYHFAGALQGTHLRVTHHQGSTFEGDLIPSNRVTGVATTPRGYRMRITLNRTPR